MDLQDRITAALKRLSDGYAPMRIPVDDTDVDVVLVSCSKQLSAKDAEIERLRNELKEWMENADMLSRKSNGFEIAYSTERKALELACDYIYDMEDSDVHLKGMKEISDYFRNKAKEK